MKLLKPLLIGASTLLFAGCCTCFPQSHTYDKDIVFVKGGWDVPDRSHRASMPTIKPNTAFNIYFSAVY